MMRLKMRLEIPKSLRQLFTIASTTHSHLPRHGHMSNSVAILPFYLPSRYYYITFISFPTLTTSIYDIITTLSISPKFFMPSLITIGRNTTLTFPQHETVPIPAKVDTGAYTSSIHAADIYLDEQQILHCLLLGEHPACASHAWSLSTTDFRRVRVTSSFGDAQHRYLIHLPVTIHDRTLTAAFTLADRSQKIYPILLGRELLDEYFLVNPGWSEIDRLVYNKRYQLSLQPDEEEKHATKNRTP